MVGPHEALAQLWAASGLDPAAMSDAVLEGSEPALPSSFAVGTAAQASIAAAGLAAATLGRSRGLPRQSVAVDMRHAAAEFHSEHWLRVNGAPPADLWDRIAGTYPCGDGRFVRLHTNFPHHRDGVLRLLGCTHEREAVRAALAGWRAFDFEQAAAEAGLCVTAMRSFAEWDAHDQGRAVQAEPLIGFERIGDAPAERPGPAVRPLDDVRVLEMTRVIAGPVGGRVLAAHGADVLRISAPHLYNFPALEIDTGRGKRNAQLDLRDAAARATMASLLRGADILMQGYRPGAIAKLGFGPEQAAALRPGIIYVSLCAYGFSGPWQERRGFDSLVQTASGFNQAEAEAVGIAGPKPLPVQALDHASGMLLALGAMAGLHRRAAEGGSWHVRVSLARTGHWIRGLGRIPGGLACERPDEATVAPFLEESNSGFGRLCAVRHAALLRATPPRWDRPAVRPGTDSPAWDSTANRFPT